MWRDVCSCIWMSSVCHFRLIRITRRWYKSERISHRSRETSKHNLWPQELLNGQNKAAARVSAINIWLVFFYKVTGWHFTLDIGHKQTNIQRNDQYLHIHIHTQMMESSSLTTQTHKTLVYMWRIRRSCDQWKIPERVSVVECVYWCYQGRSTCDLWFLLKTELLLFRHTLVEKLILLHTHSHTDNS